MRIKIRDERHKDEEEIVELYLKETSPGVIAVMSHSNNDNMDDGFEAIFYSSGTKRWGLESGDPKFKVM